MTTSETAVAAIIMLGGLGLWFWSHREAGVRYRRRTLLTGCDREFFDSLRQALPESMVFPRLPAAALIEPAGIGAARHAALLQIESRHAGFAVFDQSLQLQAVVELDHRPRRSRTSRRRDGCFESAGIPVVRFHSRRLPSQDEIRRTIFDARGSAGKCPAPRLDRPIEFRRAETPWRNTTDIHL